MAKARAIVKRRKAVRNIRKITKTMQMIATAKFQKALKRAVGTKHYTLKVRELVADLASSVGDVEHPLLRRPEGKERSGRIAVIVISSNRGLAGAYNGSILRTATAFLRQQEAAGNQVELHVSGKKGVNYFNFQRREIARRYDEFADAARWEDVERLADGFIDDFVAGRIDALHVVYMNFISTATQRPEVLTLLPLSGLAGAAEHGAQQIAEGEAQIAAGMLHTGATSTPTAAQGTAAPAREVIYDFTPSPKELLDELLPLTVKSALFQCFLDATTSENVARMVAMKSATDNADKMVKSLTMQYNRARQSQITTELSEIMGGVEAMKA
jgi:F-type H+-transporting ATPase subunit gamma